MPVLPQPPRQLARPHTPALGQHHAARVVVALEVDVEAVAAGIGHQYATSVRRLHLQRLRQTIVRVPAQDGVDAAVAGHEAERKHGGHGQERKPDSFERSAVGPDELGRLEDDGVSRDQRRRGLPHGNRPRKIPGCLRSNSVNVAINLGG